MRTLIADDHPLFREALELSIRHQWPAADIAVVGSLDEAAFDGAGIEERSFDLIVLDWHMPGVGGGDPITRLRTLGILGPIAVVTGAEQPALALEALRCGASAFLPKTTPRRVLAPSLNVVAEGGTIVPAGIVLAVAGDDGRHSANDEDSPDEDTPNEDAPNEDAGEHASLTDREREVFTLLSTGATNKEIARRLELAEVTVKFHTRRIFKKLGARNRADAVRRAQGTGLFGSSAS